MGKSVEQMIKEVKAEGVRGREVNTEVARRIESAVTERESGR